MQINGSSGRPNDYFAPLQKLISDAKSESKAERYRLRQEIARLTDTLETPEERALRIVFENTPPMVAPRIALEAEWLQELVRAGIGLPVTVAALSKASGAEESLIVRIMRLLTAIGYVDEQDVNAYAANDLTKAFASAGISDLIKHSSDSVNVIFANLPQYLVNTEFKEPTSYQLGPHVYTFGLPLWKRLELEPQRGEQFNRVMMGFRQNRESFVDIFPFKEHLSSMPLEANEVLFVDVAGGVGHRVRLFRERFPQLAGRAVLQDLQHVLPGPTNQPELFRDLQDRHVELMAHDMFRVQPIRGARYFFFSAIFHGRPDVDALKILQNTVPAMDRTSRILIYDIVVPEKGVDLFHACFDLWMMADVTGKERTRRQWDNLFATCGLQIVEVHTKGFDNVIEVGLTDQAVVG